MITFFRTSDKIYAVESSKNPDPIDFEKLLWLFSDAKLVPENIIAGKFVGPRREMITPWSTNAVEITQNMGISGIRRIEEFTIYDLRFTNLDPMLQHVYDGLDQEIFYIVHQPDPVLYIEDIAAYNRKEGLALSSEEIGYLTGLSRKLRRSLTDSEVFGFSQVNSEHCRHKIFNGAFIIDGREMPESLFSLIRKTSKQNPGFLVSAYKDNVAFILGPAIDQFAPERQDIAGYFTIKEIESVISLKAETHNFPTTVEPFNGAATGSGGEIRDR
ncbi:MAG: phosphoribosylformylglycinamidine synthase, partial [bacterium]